MGASVGRSLIASPREAGVGCPHCSLDVALGQPVVVCQACGTVHHQPCWESRGGCGSYACAPARRPEVAAVHSEPVLVISAAEIDRAIPLSATGLPLRAAAGAATIGPDGRIRYPAGFRPVEAPGPKRVRISKLAIASLVCALLGIPMLGVPGLIAVFLGLLAVASVRSGERRGLGLAVPGMVLGLLDVVGWALLFSMVPWHSLTADRIFTDPPPDLASIQELDPPLQRAMRANVLIERPHGLSFLGGRAIGSGVILRIDRGDALIVTNRHVVDDRFPSDYDGSAERLAKVGRLTVRILGQPDHEGEVVWMAPGQVDLALVRTPCSPTSMAQEAYWQKGRPMRVGDTVFAIGNPHDLGWSHTRGVISAFRPRDIGPRRIRVIQTQAAINPGNSGGGLYDQEGYCLGINTWTADKSISEGISFAIVLDTLSDLAPPALADAPQMLAAPARPKPRAASASRPGESVSSPVPAPSPASVPAASPGPEAATSRR